MFLDKNKFNQKQILDLIFLVTIIDLPCPSPEFDLSCARLLLSRCLTCLLGLQDVQ